MKQETRNGVLALLCVLVLAGVTSFLKGQEGFVPPGLLVNIVFFAVLIPSITTDTTSKAPPCKRRWTDIAWLILGIVLSAFYLLRTVGVLPGGRPELMEGACALLLLYLGVTRVARPRAYLPGREAALLAIIAAGILAVEGMTRAGR